jgi:hypothetical protein
MAISYGRSRGGTSPDRSGRAVRRRRGRRAATVAVTHRTPLAHRTVLCAISDAPGPELHTRSRRAQPCEGFCTVGVRNPTHERHATHVCSLNAPPSRQPKPNHPLPQRSGPCTESQPRSAAASSALTASSDSTAALATNAALASSDLTRLSAQAACARTSGSRSESADISTGTASGDPQFPSPTQTLRAKPARPARRMADPLENASQASSSSAVSSNSISDGASVPGMEATAEECDSARRPVEVEVDPGLAR